MINLQIPDVALEFLNDGLVRIEQSAGCGDTVMVDLHPVHVSFIAERMGLLKSVPELSHGTDSGQSKQIATLTRRVVWLAERIDEIAERLPSDMDERCGDAYAFNLWLRMLESATAELVADVEPFQEQYARADQEFSEAVKEDSYAIRAGAREGHMQAPPPSPAEDGQLSMPLASCNPVALETN